MARAKKIRESAHFSVMLVREPLRANLRGHVRWANDEEGTATLDLSGEWADAVAEDLALGLTGLTRKERDLPVHTIGTDLGPVKVWMDLR